MSNLGNDFYLVDSDISYNNLGDYLFTDDYESVNGFNSFAGETCLFESMSRYLYYLAGELSIFDITEGAGAEDLVSVTNREEAFSSFKSRALEQFNKDDRIKRVVDITFQEESINLVNIFVTLIVQGASFTSSYIFPFAA